MNAPKSAESLSSDAKEKQEKERYTKSIRSTWISIVVNVILTITQIIVGITSKSQALIADGLHSLSDLMSDFVVLFASHHGRKEADEDHPYGHQRFETAASLALGALMLLVGLGMLWSALAKLQNPELISQVHVAALWVALGTLLAKELLFKYLISVAKKIKSSLLAANAWHARSDAASSLVVCIGIAGNLAGYPLLDPVAALIVGLMIIKMGWKFGWGALKELVDHSADAEEIQAIRQTLAETPGVKDVHDIRTRKMGDMIIADAHIAVEASITVEAGHDIAALAAERVMVAHDVLNIMIHVDPWRIKNTAFSAQSKLD